MPAAGTGRWLEPEDEQVRRWGLTLLLAAVAVVAADQWARAEVQNLLERTVADELAAGSADVRIEGLLVLPQLLGGQLREVDVEVRDALVGDPAVRLAAVDATLDGLVVAFPPPDALDRVAVDGGDVRIVVLPRELQRLFSGSRPGWQLTTSAAGLRATGEVQGVPVAVTADVRVVGRELRLTARDVEVGELGLGAANTVAAAFDTRIALPVLPDGIVLDGAESTAGGLVLTGRVVDGLQLRG